MSGQGIIIVGDSQWTVTIMTSTQELAAGLSGVVSIPAGTGMLFDMGSDRSSISVNMAEMLFSLDIVFINSTGVVVGVLRDVEPGESAAFDAGSGLGARYFLEVNAGEAIGVSVGDVVQLSGGVIQPPQSIVQTMFWGVVATAVVVPIAAAIGTAVGSKIEGKSKGGEHHSIHGPERVRLVRQYGSWAVGRAESVCPEDDVQCVEHEAAEFLTKFKAGRWP